MSRLGACPLHALRACSGLAFWPLEQRLAAKAASRRWREAAADPELWAELEVPGALAALLPALLRRHGEHLRRLAAAAAPAAPPERRFAGLLASLAACGRLAHLSLRGLYGPEITKCVADLALPSVRVLALGYSPYFILSNYSHHTGVPTASVAWEWLARTFPRLEELACDYLQIPQGCAVTLPSLRRLSLVAVVRDSEVHALWGSDGCARDLAAVACAAPRLERLEWRDPKLHLGRMSWRPSQSAEDLCWLCRRFCAMDPSQLAGVRQLLPRLARLEVATLREDADFDLEGCDLMRFLGLGCPSSQGSGSGAGQPSNAAGGGGGAAGSGREAPLQLCLGGLGQDFAERWRAAARRAAVAAAAAAGPGPTAPPPLALEFGVGPPPAAGTASPSRPRVLLQAAAEAALQEANLASALRRQFPSAAALWDSDSEEASGSSAGEREEQRRSPAALSGGSVLGSPAASSADGAREDAAGEPDGPLGAPEDGAAVAARSAATVADA